MWDEGHGAREGRLVGGGSFLLSSDSPDFPLTKRVLSVEIRGWAVRGAESPQVEAHLRAGCPLQISQED